ncbi:YjgN family protein [Xenophilus arseniciresistens]|uniref:YjgN family protein n=1 Tax=Xenophilus arseniciresistens TaxID=1283306 RepID=A0AAE3T1C8_9BURK|nr:YjgN family protein [Xenophilus arseniciresistens]MDA7417861.1 YjgN family protein [Xenophilus arseniciresistens]
MHDPDPSAAGAGDTRPPETPASSSGTPAIEAHRIGFSGDGGVYFGVWIVNVLLTIITLGLYTPWARRRTARYFYGHTDVAGQPLEFTAGIRSMVVGFVLFALLYIAMEVAGNLGQDWVVGVIMLGAVLLAPWLWGSAMRFRLFHTRWRGLRLHFGARWREVYAASWPVFAIAAVWVAAGLALSQMIDRAQAEQRASQAQEALQAPSPEAPIASAEPEPAQEGEEPELTEEELAEIQAAIEAATRAAGEEGSEEGDASPAEDGDSSGEAPDLDSLPRPTWPMAGVALAALFLSFLCFIRLEFNYKRLLVSRTRIGGQVGRWKPVFNDFLRVWLATVGVFLLTALAIAALTSLIVLLAGLGAVLNAMGGGSGRSAGMVLLFMLAFFVGFFGLFLAGSPALAYREARMFQLMWNNIGLGQVARFRSELKPMAFVWLRIKNILLGMITFGFYRPFARVAEYRMKAESVTLHIKGELDQLVGQLEAQQKEGFGDAVADALGLDLVG